MVWLTFQVATNNNKIVHEAESRNVWVQERDILTRLIRQSSIKRPNNR